MTQVKSYRDTNALLKHLCNLTETNREKLDKQIIEFLITTNYIKNVSISVIDILLIYAKIGETECNDKCIKMNFPEFLCGGIYNNIHSDTRNIFIVRFISMFKEQFSTKMCYIKCDAHMRTYGNYFEFQFSVNWMKEGKQTDYSYMPMRYITECDTNIYCVRCVTEPYHTCETKYCKNKNMKFRALGEEVRLKIGEYVCQP